MDFEKCGGCYNAFLPSQCQWPKMGATTHVLPNQCQGPKMLVFYIRYVLSYEREK